MESSTGEAHPSHVQCLLASYLEIWHRLQPRQESFPNPCPQSPSSPQWFHPHHLHPHQPRCGYHHLPQLCSSLSWEVQTKESQQSIPHKSVQHTCWGCRQSLSPSTLLSPHWEVQC